jgi:hypothetical protein
MIRKIGNPTSESVMNSGHVKMPSTSLAPVTSHGRATTPRMYSNIEYRRASPGKVIAASSSTTASIPSLRVSSRRRR